MADYIPNTPRSIPEVRGELDKIAAAIRTTLHRDGTAPNQMEADLDMNSFRILNLPEPVLPTDVVRLQDIQDGLVPSPPPTDVTNSFVLATDSTTPRKLGDRMAERVNVLDWGAVGDGVTDDSNAIRAAIAYIQEGDTIKTLYSPAGYNYLIGTVETVPEYGGTANIVITDINKVRIDFNGSRFTDGVALAKDAVLAIAPSSSASGIPYAFGNVDGLWLEGNQTVRPTNVVKADYRSLAYCVFRDMRMRFSSGDNWRSDGFVMRLEFLRCSFAGTQASNFHFINTAGAANTGYNVTSCTGDYAGYYNFRFSGANGHTYCHLDNCYADFAGRDDAGDTIDANIGIAAGYRLENVRVVVMTGCGTEFCTKVVSTNNARALTINGLYALGSGHKDGSTPVPNRIEFLGFSERITVSGVQFNSASGPATNIVDLESPSAFNQNQISVPDGCLLKSYFNYIGGDETSAPMPLVTTPEDHYADYNRRGSGDALVTGTKLVGSTAAEWANQSFYSAEQTWTKATSGTNTVYQLLSLTDSTASGYLGVVVEVNIGRFAGATPHAPVKFVGSAGRASGAFDIVAPEAQMTNPDIAAPTLAWNGTTLELTVPDNFAGVFIRAIATGRKSTGVQTFEWL